MILILPVTIIDLCYHYNSLTMETNVTKELQDSLVYEASVVAGQLSTAQAKTSL